jgi:hypothetical protein
MKKIRTIVLILTGTITFTACQYLLAAEVKAAEPNQDKLKQVKAILDKLAAAPNRHGEMASAGKAGAGTSTGAPASTDTAPPGGKAPDTYTAEQAAKDITGIVPNPGPHLIHIIKKSSDHRARTCALTLLDKIKPGSSKALLTGFLNKTDSTENLIFALGVVWRELTPDEVKKHIIPLLVNTDKGVRKRALKILVFYITRIPDLAALVIKQMKSSDVSDEMKMQSIRLLGNLKSSLAESELLALSRGDTHAVRVEALNMLGYLKSERAVKRLCEAVEKDGSPEIRKMAVIGIGRSGSEDAARVLISALDDEDANVRKAAANALRNITGTNMGASKELWEKWQTARESYPDGSPPLKKPESVFEGKAKSVSKPKPKEKEANFIIVLIACLVVSAFVYVGLWKLFTSLGFQMQPGVLNISCIAKIVILGILFFIILLFFI